MNQFNNKNVSPLLLLALFITVTTFSMNAEAAEINVYNYVKEGTLISIFCTTEKESYPTVLIAYAIGTYNRTVDVTMTCTFKWGQDSHVFDIFDPARDTCKICVWVVRAAGPCLQHSLIGANEQCYSWKS